MKKEDIDTFEIVEDTLAPGSKRDKTKALPTKRVEANIQKSGNRNSARALHRKFVGRLAADFRKNGIEAIERVRKENPAEYLKIITRVLPKDLNISVEHTFSDVLNEANERIKARKEKEIDGDFEVVKDE